MYKVFVNNRPIILAGQGIQEKFEHNTLFMRYDSPETLDILLKMGHEEGRFFNKIYLLHPDEDELFRLFCKKVKIIEAAGGRVRDSKNRLLMIFRSGRWDLPKGKIEKGESPEVAALREVEEECGIGQLSIERPLTITYHTYQQGQKYVLKKTHWFEMKCADKRKLIPQEEEGITDVRWMDALNVQTALQNTFASIEEVVETV
ncbi:MAG: NUDIX hydrolase [Bacteroidia bacterium]